MSYEKIKSISIKDGKVFLTSKCNNDTEPVKRWECTSLSEIAKNKGEDAAHLEIMREYENGNFQSTCDNKYTRALRVLKAMPEYKSFNWRLGGIGEEYDKISNARRTEAFNELLRKSLAVKAEKKPVIVSRNHYDGQIIFLKRLTARGSKWSFSKNDAKIFPYAQDVAAISNRFENGSEWQIVPIS
jgi:hypothetical protein